MSEQSELAVAIRENTEAIRDLRRSINTLTGRVDRLDSRMEKQEQATTALTTTMERVNVRLASKLDAPELGGFVEATNKRFERIERHLELA
jgi:chromosome segregation ATPase